MKSLEKSLIVFCRFSDNLRSGTGGLRRQADRLRHVDNKDRREADGPGKRVRAQNMLYRGQNAIYTGVMSAIPSNGFVPTLLSIA